MRSEMASLKNGLYRLIQTLQTHTDSPYFTFAETLIIILLIKSIILYYIILMDENGEN